jgi:hypothetical protein
MRKAYIRHRDEHHPATSCTYDAWHGLHQLGIETEPFYGFGDLSGELEDEISDEVMVVGYIGDVLNGLRKLGKELPERMDYPLVLQRFFGRKIWQSTLGDIRRTSEKVFIKPAKEEKLFTGFVWDNTPSARLKIVTEPDDVVVWVSEPVNFVSEFRCYILEGEILDVCRYKGIWAVHPDKDIIKEIVSVFEDAPVAYLVDVGVLGDGSTRIVEINDCYACGNYGLNNVLYAKMLIARWEQLVREPRKKIVEI